MVRSVIVLGLLSTTIWVSGVCRAEDTKEEFEVSRSAEKIRLAVSIPAMPKFTPAAMPMALTTDPIQDFKAADRFLADGDLTTAISRYMALIEQYPDSEQAKAADGRMDYLVYYLPESELDQMEAGYPADDELTTVMGKNMAAQFYFNRAIRLMDTDTNLSLN